MSSDKRKILILTEGQKPDISLMQHLLGVYGISELYRIVSYNTDLYCLYDYLFYENDPDSMDILQALKEHEKNAAKKEIFDELYTDILLIFDFDPQATTYSQEKIEKLVGFFRESSDMGKLYLNYPMIEAFYHMKSIPDPDYYDYTVSLRELQEKTFKTRVNQISYKHDYQKFAQSKEECSTVIRQNIIKAWLISSGAKLSDDEISSIPDASDVLGAQLGMLNDNGLISILATCGFYIFDYNPALLG